MDLNSQNAGYEYIPTKRNGRKILISGALLTVIGIWLYQLVKSQKNEIASLSLQYPLMLTNVGILILLSIFTWSVELRVLLAHQKIKIGSFEAFCLLMVSGLYNYLTFFRGGLAVRTLYLCNRYHWSILEQVTFFSSRFVINILVSSITGILIVSILIWQQGVDLLWILGLFSLVAFLSLFAFSSLPLRRISKINFFKRIAPYLEIWVSVRKDRKILISLLCTNLSRITIQAGIWYYSFRVLGIEVSTLGSLFLSVLSELSLLISVTPGGLGIQEGLAVLSADTISISETHILAAAIVRRAVLSFVLLVFGLPGTLIIMKEPKQSTA